MSSYILMMSRPSLNLGYLGSKTGSLGQIIEKPCLLSGGHILLRSPRNVLVVEKALGRSWPIHPKYQGWMDDLSRLIPRGVALTRITGWKMVTGRDEDGVTGLREPPVTYSAPPPHIEMVAWVA